MNDDSSNSNLSRYLESPQRWLAIRSRDPAANSAFYYGVTSTSIFCRPTCPARVARRNNVIFFDDLPSARKAGYRPCKRCDPQNVSWHRNMRSKADFDTAKSLIEGSEKQGEVWTVASVAEEVGVSIGHLHRLFKKYANTTPKDFVSANKMLCSRRKSSLVSDRTSAVAISDDSSVDPGHLARVPLQHQNYSSQDHEAFSQALLAGDFWLGARGSEVSLPITNDQVGVSSNTASDDFTCHDLLDSSTGLAQLEDALSFLDWTALYMPTDDHLPPEVINYMDSFQSILDQECNGL